LNAGDDQNKSHEEIPETFILVFWVDDEWFHVFLLGHFAELLTGNALGFGFLSSHVDPTLEERAHEVDHTVFASLCPPMLFWFNKIKTFVKKSIITWYQLQSSL
jgi:hypothetical protein